MRIRIGLLACAMAVVSAGSVVRSAPQGAGAAAPITYYLSEGATGSFFDEDILIANPNDAAAPVTLIFSSNIGTQVTETRTVPPQSHITVSVGQISGLSSAEASTQVRSDAGLPLLVERTMFWDKTRYAGHTGSAVDQPSTDWFFAEGAQGFFDTFILVINPNASATQVTFTFLRENAPAAVKTIALGAHTRYTLPASEVPELADGAFGIAVHAAQPIMAERAMYFSVGSRFWSGGHESAGVTVPSTRWFLAEGATGSMFDTFILLSNPSTTTANVTLTYLLDTGDNIAVQKTLGPNARLTTHVADDDPRLRSANVSTVVTSDQPVIAERSMYWPGASWRESHNSFGVVDAATLWGLAEGRTGGDANYHTYVLLANPSTTPAQVTVRFLRENGPPVIKVYTVAAASRFTIDVGAVPELKDESFGAVIQVANKVPIIVERSLYWDADDVAFSGGTNATGLRLAIGGADGPGGCSNLVSDPGFELGVSGFEAKSSGDSVTQSRDAALDGDYSLRVALNGDTNAAEWRYTFQDGVARRFTVGAHLRSDQDSASDLQFCAIATYADGSVVQKCTTVKGTAGDKGSVTAALDLNGGKTLASLGIRLRQAGSTGLKFTVDSLTTCLDLVTAPPNGGGDGTAPIGGGGDDGKDYDGSSCTPSPQSKYRPTAYTTPANRPYISLSSYTTTASPTAFTTLRQAVDAKIKNHNSDFYAYSAEFPVIVYKLTGDEKYIREAIRVVDEWVTEAEQEIAKGNRPELASDSYLPIGNFFEELALTYDYGFNFLTPAQKQRWSTLAETSLYNLWHPDKATWGGKLIPWSGIALCSPGGNYFYSFFRATMLWGLASQNKTWLDLIQRKKMPLFVDYFAAIPGGGTREGTGYGTAIGAMFKNYIYWKGSTGEDVASLTPHVRETIDYWTHATIPTLGAFAPIGDLSRESYPSIYDYHVNLVHWASFLSPGTEQAKRGTWWSRNNTYGPIKGWFNLHGALLPFPDQPQAPTALTYRATGAGAFFARTGWTTGATWMAMVAGKFEQNHAHHDQGSFSFYKNDWLTVTSNIWSHGGIHQEDEAHNVVRFVRNGETIGQNQSDASSTLEYTTNNGVVVVDADLSNAYTGHRTQVKSWRRHIEMSANLMKVNDTCVVGAGVSPIFQLHVPSPPVQQADGSIQAGPLNIKSLLPLQSATWLDLTTIKVFNPYANEYQQEFYDGFRIELTPVSGCAFQIELRTP